VQAQARELAVPMASADFSYEPRDRKPYPKVVQFIRTYIFRIFLLITFGGTFVFLVVSYLSLKHHDDKLLLMPCNQKWKSQVKYASIPLVSIVFTWWHVWLGIKMCFYPVEFKGCCAPYLGWQGIVPRRARIMAERSCDIMIGTLITVEEIIARIEPDSFFTDLARVIEETSATVLTALAEKHCPNVWEKLSEAVKDELQSKVIEESRNMFDPVIVDLKTNINTIVDIKEMAIEVLLENKPLLVEMFQEIGNREFIFIQHVAAVMGFVLGMIQMSLWLVMQNNAPEWAGYVILPVSGLIIGYLTNWLGITMIFRPVEPHLFCFGYVNIQGVFLKRQQEVSKELAGKICSNLVHARKMLEYVARRPAMIEQILKIYNEHMLGAMSRFVSDQGVVSWAMGQEALNGIKQDIMGLTLDQLPKHSQEIETYMDKAFDLKETLTYRLQHLHPARFEGMLHPVFQEDEWMVLLLGGVLGVVVGTLQAFALGS